MNLNLSRLIFIDAGHGGEDLGHTFDGVKEKEVCLNIAMLVGALLQTRGYSVLYSRNEDINATIQDRIIYANNTDADCYVSVHCNYNKYTDHFHGCETLYRKNDLRSASLAKSIQTKVVSAAGAKNLLVRGTDNNDELNAAKLPAVVVNVGYLSHEVERQLMNSSIYQQALASSICEGIDRYFNGDYI